jgi:protein-S-isoprenylcysteine O-methyltransferase Ste14
MKQSAAVVLAIPATLTHRNINVGRLLSDRLLPALVFGAAAAFKCLGLLVAAGRGPSDAGTQSWLTYGLDLMHQTLSVLFLALIATLFLVRHAPRGSRAGPVPFAVALLGSFVMNAAIFQPSTSRDLHVLALADLLMVAGGAFTIYSLASLRHCFGIAPEARGLVTTGAYRLVRHPMYVGEFIACLGAILPVIAPLSAMIFAVFCLLQAGRAALEERVLGATFPEYADYRRSTPAVLPWPRPNCPCPSS